MNINFIYDEEKDIECLLTKGPGSMNSPGNETRVYKELLLSVPDLNNRESVRKFVRDYIRSQGLDIDKNLQHVENSWNAIRENYHKRAEEIFGVTLPSSIEVYLTITGRYPYSIEKNYFYVSAIKQDANSTIMHELWHFYTWYAFKDHAVSVDPQRYNDFKESLTVLLNIECKDLMNGLLDKGYPQHQELRAQIVEAWTQQRNIQNLARLAL